MTRYVQACDHIVVRDGQALVMVGDTVLLLGPLATVIVDSLASSLDEQDLYGRVIAALGDAPSDAHELIRAAIAELIASKVLREAL